MRSLGRASTMQLLVLGEAWSLQTVHIHLALTQLSTAKKGTVLEWLLAGYIYVKKAWHHYALAKWTCKSMHVFILRSTCVLFGHLLEWTCNDLHGLVLILVELKFAYKSMQGFQHKLIASHLYMHKIYSLLWLAWACQPTCKSPPFTSPYASSGFVSSFGLRALYKS